MSLTFIKFSAPASINISLFSNVLLFKLQLSHLFKKLMYIPPPISPLFSKK